MLMSIVLLTARPHRVHELTEAWLRRYQIRWDLLVMRPWGDYDLSRDFKQSTVWELRSAGFDLRLATEMSHVKAMLIDRAGKALGTNSLVRRNCHGRRNTVATSRSLGCASSIPAMV